MLLACTLVLAMLLHLRASAAVARNACWRVKGATTAVLPPGFLAHPPPPRQAMSSTTTPSPDPRIHMSSAADDPATTTTPTTRRRRRPSGGPKPSREFVGVAKGTDTGQFRAYSAEQFVKGASGLPDMAGKPHFTVLGIETSCDDTGVAVVRSDGVILGEALASQYQIHEQWGGVVPGLARDAHASVIDAMVEQALRNAGLASAAEVDAVGVTVGPGLEICLRVGCETAKALAVAHAKPFVAVHHLEAHCLMSRLGHPLAGDEPRSDLARFPFLVLLVSGGHCLILECQDVGRYRILGGTLDDALGEAYDKAARLLKIGNGVAGGPAMEALAREGNPKAVPLPVPMKGKKNLNFSYAGLKNAFRMAVTRLRESMGLDEEAELDAALKADLAASFQHVAIQHLEERLDRAMQQSEARGIHTLAVVGGVAANQAIRGRLQALCEKRNAARTKEQALGLGEWDAVPPVSPPWELVVPPPRLCTDNGVMVAWAAIEKLRLGYSDAVAAQDVYARWPFANLEKQPKEEEKMEEKVEE